MISFRSCHEPVGVPPIRAMEFPHEDVKARLRVRCDSVLIECTELHWDSALRSDRTLSGGRHGIRVRADGEDISDWVSSRAATRGQDFRTALRLPGRRDAMER